MNMRKIIAVLAAVLMLCAIVPMGVFAAPGDVVIEKNFDDGSAFSNGSNENGYMVFDATTADWANVYLYANAIKNATKYEITFDCKANKATNINVKINDNWTGDTFKWTTNVTTEWETYTCVITTNELKELTSTALLMFTSNTTAANGAVYHIDNVVVKEYLDPAIIGKVTNGSFEDSTNGWSTNSAASLVTDAKDGTQALQMSNPSAWASVATQTIPVEANASYEITWYSKRISGTGAFNLIACQAVSPWANYTKVAGQNWMNETSGNWVANSYTVNVGDNTSMLLKFTTEAANPGVILIDNVVVSKLKDPSFDGYITNGDFETGKTNPWDIYSSTAVTADAAKSGDYGMMLSGGGASYGGIANQNFTVEVGKTYVVRFDMKVVNAGINVQVKNAGANVASGYLNKTEWNTYSYEFTATATNSNLNFCGSGIAGTDVAYLDNVLIYEKVEQSNDGYIVNGTFDTGVLTPWNNLWGSCPTAEVIVGGKDSTFALHIVSGLWKHVRQTNIAVEANTDYKITVWAKDSKNMSLLVKDGGDSKDLKNVGLNAGAEWTQFTAEFNTGDYTSIIVSFMGGADEAYGTFDTVVMEKVHTCEFVGTVTKEPSCTETGVMTYACTCGEGTYTEEIPMVDHSWVDASCDNPKYCSVCGKTEGDVAHGNIVHVEAKDATCTALGNIEYWYCETCGQAWLDEACTMNTNMMAVKLPMVDHEYFYPCDPVCMNCGEITNPDAAHSVQHVEAKAATCYENGNVEYWYCEACGQAWTDEALTQITNVRNVVVPMAHAEATHVAAVTPTCEAEGNIEYWYCEACGQAWLDEACTLNTNLMAVKLPMAEHEYFYACDAYCMNCGEQTNPRAKHNKIHVEAKEAVSCVEYGNIEYWYCEYCGTAWTDEAGRFQTNMMSVRVAGECVSDAEYACQDGVCVNCGLPCAAEVEHSYFYPCDPVCQICYEVTNPDATHTIVHVEAVAPTCTAMGNIEYWYCSDCGAAWSDEACTQITSQMSVKLPMADHDYVGEVTEEATCDLTGTMTYTCSVCGDSYTEEIPAWHDGNLTHVPAVEATDCAHPGNIEYYTCPWCNEYFTDANASEMINPWFIEITVDCVRPEGVADCANWTCETCGTENYGYGEHNTGVPACQDGHCSKCDQDIAGFGCANYDTPACEDGVCYYCGGFVAGLGHENGAWAPCQDGECSYGCGLTYPATAEHVDEDGDDYCDTCWSHLNHIDDDGDHICDTCWNEIEGLHIYDNDYDVDCNECGAIREVELPIAFGGNSVSEDVNGLAFKFDVSVLDMAIVAGTKTEADYTNATVDGYKLVKMGAVVSNGVSEKNIEAVYLCDLSEDSASFAVRVINIPADKLDVEITAIPYVVIEIDGVEVTINGEAVTASYNAVLG